MDKRYYSEYAEVEENHWWFAARRKILARIIEFYFPLQDFQRVLDIGVGTGSQSKLFEKCPTVVGLDREEIALTFNRSKTQLHLVQGDAESLPFTEESFDLVSGLDILEHLEDDFRTLKEMMRVCKRDGFLLLTVPAYQFLWSQHDEINHHKRRYSRNQLEKILLESGWNVIKLSYFNTFLFPVIAMIRVCSSRMSREKRQKSDFTLVLPYPMNFLLMHLFSLERRILPYLDFPYGTSLLCVAKRPRILTKIEPLREGRSHEQYSAV